MVDGYVTNNTGKSLHIFKRTVYPGQRIPLDYVHQVVGSKVPTGESFVEWLEGYVPDGWEVVVSNTKGSREFIDPVLPKVVESENEQTALFWEDNNGLTLKEEEEKTSLAYAPIKEIDKLTARDIYNLKTKDNPKRVIKQITSVHKLRRALTLCKNDSRKAMLTRIIQHRIRELNQFL